MAPTPNIGGLRSRKVDNRKYLPVYRHGDLDDFDEAANVSRIGQHVVSSGVELEERDEHHLQAALNSNYVGTQHAIISIPTPDATERYPLTFYKPDFVQQDGLVQYSDTFDFVAGCPYNLDAKDDIFIKAFNDGNHLLLSDDTFEDIVWAMERAANDKVSGVAPSLSEVMAFFETEATQLLFFADFIAPIYSHWIYRRFDVNAGAMITPCLKIDDVSITQDTDPYICFRKREIKTLRKRGRTDTYSFDKLMKLKEELTKVQVILQSVVERERLRKESYELQKVIFEKRNVVRKYRKMMGIVVEKESDASPERVRRRGTLSTKVKVPLLKYKESMNDAELREHIESSLSSIIDDVAANERALQKKASDSKSGWIDCTDNMYQPYYYAREDVDEWSNELSLLSLSSNSKTRPPQQNESTHSDHIEVNLSAQFENNEYVIERGRRRVGRGGRIFIDQHCRYKPSQQSSEEECVSPVTECDDESGTDIQDSPSKPPRSGKWNSYLKYKQNYDDEDHVVVREVELKDSSRNFSWRAFNICATNDVESRNLITRPTFPDQNCPVPSPFGSRPKDLAPQIIRQGSGPSNPVKKKQKTAEQAKALVALNKKKQAEALDPRAATIKAMMQQAQRQAQVTQQQIQQQIHASAQQSNASSNHSISNQDSSNQSPKEITPSELATMPPSAIEIVVPLPVVPVKPAPRQRSTQQQQQQLLQQQQQAFRMQPPMPHQMQMINPNMTQQQQMQQMYFNHAQQQQQQLMIQSQGRARMGMGIQGMQGMPQGMPQGMMGRSPGMLPHFIHGDQSQPLPTQLPKK